jgi:hypothetical protein
LSDPGPALQFDRAEFEGAPAAATACAVCAQPLADTYYEVSGAVVCERCRNEVEAQWNAGTGVGRVARALAFGIAAAAGGSALYAAAWFLFDSQLAIIAIVVGFMVGAAVRAGAQRRGGRVYQTLAVFLTYTAIVSSYIWIAYQQGELAEAFAQAATPAHAAVMAVVLLFVMYAVPFKQGLNSLLLLLIIGIGLYQAWSMNRRNTLRISGPYSLRTRPTAPANG